MWPILQQGFLVRITGILDTCRRVLLLAKDFLLTGIFCVFFFCVLWPWINLFFIFFFSLISAHLLGGFRYSCDICGKKYKYYSCFQEHRDLHAVDGNGANFSGLENKNGINKNARAKERSWRKCFIYGKSVFCSPTNDHSFSNWVRMSLPCLTIFLRCIRLRLEYSTIVDVVWIHSDKQSCILGWRWVI